MISYATIAIQYSYLCQATTACAMTYHVGVYGPNCL